MRKRFEGRLEIIELELRIAPSALFGPLGEGLAAFGAAAAPPDFSLDVGDDFAFDTGEETSLQDLDIAALMNDPVGAIADIDAADEVNLDSLAIEWTEPFEIEADEALLVTIEEGGPLPEMTQAEVQVEIAAAPAPHATPAKGESKSK